MKHDIHINIMSARMKFLLVVIGLFSLITNQSLVTGGFAENNARAEDHYNSCMALAEINPDKGINMALAWLSDGGGVPARHCEATGLFYIGEYNEAAARFEKLADDMRRGRDMPIDGDKRVVAKAPLLADIYHQAASAWILGGEVVRAETAIDTALSLAVSGGYLYQQYQVTRAQIAGADSDFSLAYDDLHAVLKSDPGRRDILLFLASAARNLNKLEEADTHLARYLETAPYDAAAYLELGNLRDQQGDKVAANKAWLRVLRLEKSGPNHRAATHNIERAVAGDY